MKTAEQWIEIYNNSYQKVNHLDLDDLIREIQSEAYSEGEHKRKIIQKKLEEYIRLLIDELDETVSIACIHGWESKRVKEGNKIRTEIEHLKYG